MERIRARRASELTQHLVAVHRPLLEQCQQHQRQFTVPEEPHTAHLPRERFTILLRKSRAEKRRGGRQVFAAAARRERRPGR